MKMFMDSQEWAIFVREGLIKGNFGKRFRQIIIDKGFNTQSFDCMLGYSNKKLHLILTEERFPSFGFLLVASKLLDVSLDHLLGLSQEKSLFIMDPKLVGLRRIALKLTILREVIGDDDLDIALYGSKSYAKTVRNKARSQVKDITQAINNILREENIHRDGRGEVYLDSEDED